MNLFHKIVMISLCSLGVVSISLHANDLQRADQYLRKIQASQTPTPEEVESFSNVKAVFNINTKENRLDALKQLKSMAPAGAESLDRIYTYLHPEDRPRPA